VGGDAVVLERWTAELPGRPAEEVSLPAHFDLPDEPLVYRLRTKVSLPEAWRGQTLSVGIPYFTGLTRLFVGEREISPLDPPSAGSYRSAPIHRFSIPAELTRRDSLPLTLEVRHEWAQSAWFDSAPRLSATVAGDSWTRFVLRWSVATSVMALLLCALVVGIAFAVWLRSATRNKHRWLALGTIGAAYYPLFQLGLTQDWLGRSDSTPLFFLLPLSCYCSIQFLWEHLGWRAAPKIWLGVIIVPGITGLVFGGPFRAMPEPGLVVFATIMVTMGAQFFVPLRLLLRGQAPVGTFAIWSGWIAVTICMAPDMSAWIGLGKWLGGLQLIHLSITIFLLTQIFALAREHAHALGTAEKLNVELRDLSQELVRQLGEREADAARRRLFADLAHELGTPTSTVIGIAETLRDGVAPDSHDKLLGVLEREGARLERLVSDVRLLAFLEQPDLQLERAACDLSEVAEAACASARLEGKLEILCHTHGPAVADVDRLRIEQVLANLLGNALRYTPEGGQIAVRVASNETAVRLEVEDSGKGVPDEMLAQLGERFARLDPSRTRRTGGHGLGLSIVTTIVQRHGGTIQFGRASLGGLAVVIELPKA
jgi:signal transduction histidine kinase